MRHAYEQAHKKKHFRVCYEKVSLERKNTRGEAYIQTFGRLPALLADMRLFWPASGRKRNSFIFLNSVP